MSLGQLLATLVVLIGGLWALGRYWHEPDWGEWAKSAADAIEALAGAFSAFSLTVQRASFEFEHFGEAISAAYPGVRFELPEPFEPNPDLPAQLLERARDLAEAADVPIEHAVDALRAALVGEVEPLEHLHYELAHPLMSRDEARRLAELPSEVGLSGWSHDGQPLRGMRWRWRGRPLGRTINVEVEPATAGDIMRDIMRGLRWDDPDADPAADVREAWRQFAPNWSPFHYYGNDPNQAAHGTDGGTPMTLEELLEADRRMDDIDRRLEGDQ